MSSEVFENLRAAYQILKRKRANVCFHFRACVIVELEAFLTTVLRLIRFKFVIHAFVDGKSRYVTRIHVGNNNRAETVLFLLESVVAQYGLPSCERGAGHGSYIWGRSVASNVSVNHGLNLSINVHIWLLHHLFLNSINEDAQEWADTWNSPDLQICGECTRSPCDIFLLSMIQDSPHDLKHFIDPPEEAVEDPSTYGVDWDCKRNG
ncbi:hypothetical protein C8R45DRAFT_1097945 [Mycena sanguinolenta]|nr:hypothetical protein C8R45DRAFT_1097945 [Mycena sanguinolenta]